MKSHVIMVGDSRPDIEAARSAGVPVIGFSGGYSDVPLEELRPDAILNDYKELAALIHRML